MVRKVLQEAGTPNLKRLLMHRTGCSWLTYQQSYTCLVANGMINPNTIRLRDYQMAYHWWWRPTLFGMNFYVIHDKGHMTIRCQSSVSCIAVFTETTFPAHQSSTDGNITLLGFGGVLVGSRWLFYPRLDRMLCWDQLVTTKSVQVYKGTRDVIQVHSHHAASFLQLPSACD